MIPSRLKRVRGWVTAVALAALLVPFSVSAAGIGKEGRIVNQKGKANTIAELVAMYDSSSCVECHQEVHDDWAQSVHARSIFGTGRTAATFRTTVINGLQEWAFSGVTDPADVEVEHLMGCAKCHLPQLADANDAVAKELIASIYTWLDAARAGNLEVREREEERLKSLNINCLVCHNRNAITHKWTDGYPQDGVVYGHSNGEHPSDTFPTMKQSMIMGESILCGQCHGLGPNLELDNPTQCATLYGSYLWSYVAEGGRETCQECHMRNSGLGHNMQSYRDHDFTRKAIDFKVETSGFYWRDTSNIRPYVAVDIAMTNKAGHVIPDG
jgi:nitrate/TMAO reductase-like tetraheme cytochrome c subunit